MKQKGGCTIPNKNMNHELVKQYIIQSNPPIIEFVSTLILYNSGKKIASR